MIKFVGKKKDLEKFIANIIERFGSNTTLKEVIERIGRKC